MIRVAIIGFGKIAADQHLPSIAADPRFELAAVATRAGDPQIGVPWFAESDAMLAAMVGQADVIAICTPPSVRHAIARDALRAGYDVLLEKPPTATLGEIEDLAQIAQAGDRVVYTSWHSRHAPAVERAAQVLAGADIARLEISWREDVRKWHPGQEWIWDAGGFGVFDTGINALSIATHILPIPLLVKAATLSVPSNRQAPIAVRIEFVGKAMQADFDWRFEGGEEWIIRVATVDGTQIELLDGGAQLLIDGVAQTVWHHGEYPVIYDRLATLVTERRSDVDVAPLRIVADAFMVGSRTSVAAFE